MQDGRDFLLKHSITICSSMSPAAKMQRRARRRSSKQPYGHEACNRAWTCRSTVIGTNATSQFVLLLES
eukprot:scaffold61969_cov48-Prasinocladus_malaysianus.AAC.3